MRLLPESISRHILSERNSDTYSEDRCSSEIETVRFLPERNSHEDNRSGDRCSEQQPTVANSPQQKQTTNNDSWRRVAEKLGTLALLLVFFSFNINAYLRTLPSSSSSSPLDAQSATSKAGDGGYFFAPVLFGHVHIAKTGGTWVNGYFANRYERVCGNKGYSYDAYAANERFKKASTNVERDKRDWKELATINKIGYEDCDYISDEKKWQYWNRFDDFSGEQHPSRTRSSQQSLPLELHIPCREPVDHLLSMCNYKKQELLCDTDKQSNTTEEFMQQAMEKCLYHMMFESDRFSMDMIPTANATRTVKCYDFSKQFDGYVQYMDGFLQRRRFVSNDYKSRETNEKREKKNECLLSDEQSELRHAVRDYMKKNIDYYKFCDKCLGGEDDITRDY